jgi:hypothetical protein
LRGHAGLRKIQAGWDEQFDDLRLDPERIIDAGENGVLALYMLRIGVKGSDRELVQPAGLHLEFLDGKCTRWHAFQSWEEALKALGLEDG